MRRRVAVVTTLGGLGACGVVFWTALAVAQPTMPGTPTPVTPVQFPDPDDLTAKINNVATPDPSGQRRAQIDSVQGADHDPLLYDPKSVAHGAHVTTFQVTNVEMQDATHARAIVDLFVEGQRQQRSSWVPFVNEDGQWKIERAWICYVTEPPPGIPPQPGC